MSLLSRFDDRECRAWFAAVLAIRALPMQRALPHGVARDDSTPSTGREPPRRGSVPKAPVARS